MIYSAKNLLFITWVKGEVGVSFGVSYLCKLLVEFHLPF